MDKDVCMLQQEVLSSNPTHNEKMHAHPQEFL